MRKVSKSHSVSAERARQILAKFLQTTINPSNIHIYENFDMSNFSCSGNIVELKDRLNNHKQTKKALLDYIDFTIQTHLRLKNV